jgi:hypothetical protein
MSERSRRAGLLAVAGYALLACAFYYPILFTNAILTGFDTVTIFYPHRAAAARALLSGRLPLWNPDHFLGAPLLANTQVAALYPLNWPLLALPPGPSLAWTMALHIVLAAVFMFVFARQALALTPLAAWLAGALFAFGGFLGQQTGHLNQVSVAAWLPLVLLLGRKVWLTPSWRNVALCSVVIALQFLAGHSQESYMILVALALYAAFLAIEEKGLRGLWGVRARLAAIVLPVVLGAALAAVQLLPTAELSSQSIRSGGLSFRQASSFSLIPQDLALSLLPNYAGPPPNEMAAYIGVLGVVLAIAGALCWRQRAPVRFLLLLAGLALLLALGRYSPLYWAAYYGLPGVSLFRAPARWLLLYSFSASILAGMGLQVISGGMDASQRRRVLAALASSALLVVGGAFWLHMPPAWVMLVWAGLAVCGAGVALLQVPAPTRVLFSGLLIVVVITEMYAAGRYLEYNRFSAPETLTALRPAVAYLMARQQETPATPWRVLSVSDATWDPGDLREIRGALDTLPASRQADYIDAVKNKELLTANLTGMFGLQSADGYDGGVLPLRRFVDMEGLFLPADALSPDGRLRDHLSAIPDARLLALLNVAYVVTDKNRDVWLDDVYYDVSLANNVSAEATLAVPHTTLATALGVISRVEGATNLSPASVIGQITVVDANGFAVNAGLVLGQQTDSGGAESSLRTVATDDGLYYHSIITLPLKIAPHQITIRYLESEGGLSLRGLSLIDQRTGASLPVTVTPDFELVHSGDVKIYRNMRNLDRAYTVHTVRVAPTGEDAVAMMRGNDFDPAREAVVTTPVDLPVCANRGADNVEIRSYDPERVVLRASMACGGLLILSDAWYPGWQATVDGAAAPILRANHMLRAVPLAEGDHEVEFVYRPRSLLVGGMISLGSLLLLGTLPKVRNLRKSGR